MNERVIAEIVGVERTVGCFVNFGADYMGPGVVEFGGRGAVVVGELDGSRTLRIGELHKLLCKFDERAVLTENIWGFLWSKMIYGALLFATAVTNEGIADLLDDPRYSDFFVRFGREVAAVAAAEGVALETFNGFYPQAFLPGASAEIIGRSFDEMVAHNRRSAKSHSGIWRDLAIRKRKTEVDAQLGPVVAIGAAHGLETPITAAVIDAIHAVEDGRAALGLAALDALDRAAPEPVAAAQMNIGIRGRRAIVTGAAHGIGRAIAVGLARRGAEVMACDIRGDELPDSVDAAGDTCRARSSM